MTEVLMLKKTMDRTYLIQRLNKPEVSPSPFDFGGGLPRGGLDKNFMNVIKYFFTFDYMGAAEFEWGAVPAAIKFVLEQVKANNVTCGQHQGVFYISPKEYENGVKLTIEKLLEDESELRLKESCGLKRRMRSLGDIQERRSMNVGWLELDNGFFFFSEEEMFNKTKILLGINETSTSRKDN